MDFPNIFTKEVVDDLTNRLNAISKDSQPQWGKMNAAQMMAHCSVAYEFVFTDKHKRPNPIARFMIKMFAKNAVVGPKPYPRNSRTAPMFIISEEKNLEVEREQLIAYMNQCLELGPEHFDGKENFSFGNLSLNEWNNMFYKHLDHHLQQFGV